MNVFHPRDEFRCYKDLLTPSSLHTHLNINLLLHLVKMGLSDLYRNIFPPKPTFTEKETPNQAGKVITYNLLSFYATPTSSSTLNCGSIERCNGRL
jgi:hypothetical protein